MGRSGMRGEDSRPPVRRSGPPAPSGTDLADEEDGGAGNDGTGVPAAADTGTDRARAGARDSGTTGGSAAALAAQETPPGRTRTAATRTPPGRTRTKDRTRPGERSRPAPAGRGGPGGGGRGGAGGPGGRVPRRRRRILRWSAMVLAFVILGTAGAGYLYYRHLNGNIKKGELNIGEHKAPRPTPNAAGQTPLNILVIGSDSRNTKENLKLGGSTDSVGAAPLADVQMLIHLSADRSNMSVVSMPRDTLIEIPKCTDPDTGKVYPASSGRLMTNQSLGRGGAGCTVATWEKLTDVHINHFVQVDFAGVVSMADAIGGVPVCVDRDIYSHTNDDKGSGLKLPKGTHSVKGEQALQWLRTRYGFGDGSDIGRAKAQHMYMSSMVREMRENATLSNPGKLRGLAETATRSLTVDRGLDTVMKLYDLGNELRKVPPDRITMTTMPFDYLGARVVPKPGDAEQLFRLIRDDVALDGKDKKKRAAAPKKSADAAADDAEIPVQVVNGTRTDVLAPARGRASTVAQLLVGKGLARAVADTQAAVTEARTVISYPSVDLEGDARRVAELMGIPLSAVKRSTDVSGVTLVVGADWREGAAYGGGSGSPEDEGTPESADLLNGADEDACMEVNPAFTY
ncbi:LCP family protein [Streptomyces uncialis]|uniref:LCP family protein n=1 Tax=Streptomyces uncialis TaxID=1048205 RepID=UPI0037B1BB8A